MNFINKVYLLLVLVAPACSTHAGEEEVAMEPGRGISNFLSHNLIVDVGPAYELIHTAAIDGDKGVLIAESRAGNVERKTVKGWTPLHFSVFYGHIDCAACLLEHGADVEAATATGWRPLHFAVEKTDVNTMRLMVWHYRARINARTAAGMTPVLLAAKNGQALPLKLLLDWGASCDEASLSGWTALHFAAVHGNLFMAQMLLKNGARFASVLKHNGATPVGIAAKHQHAALVQWLLTQWARMRSEYRVHPIHIAAKLGLLETVKNFVSHDSHCVRVRTVFGVTPMLFAARSNQAAVVTWLITEAYVNVNEALPGGTTALHYAAGHDNLPLVKLLIWYGADKEARTCAGCTPLYVALAKRRAVVARYLIEQGANLDGGAVNGHTSRSMANALGLTSVILRPIRPPEQNSPWNRPHLTQSHPCR